MLPHKHKSEVCGNLNDFRLTFSTNLTYPCVYTILVSTACPVWWKKNIIYVANVYIKNKENTTLSLFFRVL